MAIASISYLPVFGDKNEFLHLVPDGKYNVVYVGHQTHRFFNGAPKVVFWFRIVDMGEHFGKLVPRYYNVKRFKGKKGRNGGFVPGRSSDFIRDYYRVVSAPVARLDRLPLGRLKNIIIQVTTRTVKNDGDQQALPDVLMYSVVDIVVGKGDI